MSTPASILSDGNDRRRVIRGLSALFWGLPLTLLFSFKTGATTLVSPPEALTPVAAFAVVYFGCTQLRSLRLNHETLSPHVDWVNLFALTNLGLSPFLYFWSRQPQQEYFTQILVLLLYSSLLFLYLYNRLLVELSNRVQEDPLRSETELFAWLNRYCLIAFAVVTGIYLGLNQDAPSMGVVSRIRPAIFELAQTVLLFLILLPLALTMTTTWRLKEALFQSLFDPCEISQASSGSTQ